MGLDAGTGIVLVMVALFAYAALVFIYLVLDNRSPQSTFAWFFLMLLLPGVGLAVYVLVGRSWRAFSRENVLLKQLHTSALHAQVRQLIDEQEPDLDELAQSPIELYRRLPHLLWSSSRAPVTTANRVEILQNASAKYPRLLADLGAARHSIHLVYYEWASDAFTTKVRDLLAERVRAGVEVRVLYDPIGSRGMLSRQYRRDMRDAGIRLLPFAPAWYLHTISYRNHRKVAVIDGRIGYAGGLNMTEKHLTGPPGFTGWRDTHVRIAGDAVTVLQSIFATQWFNTTGERLTDPAYYPRVGESAHLPVQVVSSGPDSQFRTLRQLYIAMIAMARDHVFIQSPFCILDESLAEVIKASAMSGVKVWVMIAPSGAEGQLAYRAGRTYAADLARAGVRVLLYRGAYFHAKTIAVDSVVCSIGSANMDVRSFLINYETNLVFYDPGLTQVLEADFLGDVASCEDFVADRYDALPLPTRLGDSIMRLVSPLL
jgi:cardiolipin synthase